jgi:hypothetical protein
MLQCAIIAGQLFLFHAASGDYVNFNAYSTFEVSEVWGKYYIMAGSYDRNDEYMVDGVVTNDMLPAILNKCAETAQ